jgi:hypothetical protein
MERFAEFFKLPDGVVLNQPLTIAEHEAKTGEVSEGVVP